MNENSDNTSEKNPMAITGEIVDTLYYFVYKAWCTSLCLDMLQIINEKWPIQLMS